MQVSLVIKIELVKYVLLEKQTATFTYDSSISFL